MTKGKSTLIQKTLQNEPPQQLKIHNIPTDDVENTKSSNYRGDIRFANKPRTLPLRKRKDAASGPKVQKTYSKLINTSLRRAR